MIPATGAGAGAAGIEEWRMIPATGAGIDGE
jgi:hypothetical protein